MPEKELVQNILRQSTPEAAWRRSLTGINWKDKYRTQIVDLQNQTSQTTNDTKNFLSNLNLTSIPINTVEDSFNNSYNTWAYNQAVKRAKDRLSQEMVPSIATNPYDVTKGWRESTEDAAKLDKYTTEELGYSPKEAQQVYNDTWNNARKQLGISTAATLGTIGTFGAAGGAFGIPVADATNALFAIDAAKNLASGEGIQKTYKLYKQGDWKGALKSGAWDALDLSMLGHTAGLAGRVGKSMFNGATLGNAYRSDVVARWLKQAPYRGSLPAKIIKN